MIVVDAHQDIAYNALKFGRDYRRSALKTRELEAQAGLSHPGATLGLPEALIGRVAVTFGTLFVAPKSSGFDADADTNDTQEYDSPQQAYALAMRQLDYYQRLADQSPQVGIIHNASDLDAILATWQDGKPVTAHKQGIVVLMEGADPIIEPRQFEEWYARGVRVVGLAWEATRYSAGTGKPGRLTALGHELLDVMASFNAILDLSHMAEDAFLEAVDRYDGVIIASHSNPRRFRNTDRHLTDEMIRRLAARDGVMGVVLYNRFLSDAWQPTDPKSSITLATVADVIDHVCQVTGSAQHVGIGSDFDGGFGVKQVPHELNTTADLILIADVLRARGYSEADIAAIMGENMLRKLKAALA